MSDLYEETRRSEHPDLDPFYVQKWGQLKLSSNWVYCMQNDQLGSTFPTQQTIS